MRVRATVLLSFVGILLWSAPVQSAEAEGAGDAFYGELEPGAFMRRWLVCGPFPVSSEDERPDVAAQRQAFYEDFLTEHGGEAEIRPTAGMVHEVDGTEYRWQLVASEIDGVNLFEVYEPQEYVVAYAWAEIEMPEARDGLLGIGTDDAMRLWLNGEPVTENWTDRPVRPDDDLVLVNFREGKNQILMKVQNQRESWGFACRLLDAATLGEKLFKAMGGGEIGVAQMCLAYGADVNAKTAGFDNYISGGC